MCSCIDHVTAGPVRVLNPTVQGGLATSVQWGHRVSLRLSPVLLATQ